MLIDIVSFFINKTKQTNRKYFNESKQNKIPVFKGRKSKHKT